MLKIGSYNDIISDHKIFSRVVYTPLSKAIRLLDERRKNPEIVAKVEKLLKVKVPEIFKNNKCGIIARQLATPNNESRIFIYSAKENGLQPVFLEYFDDKLTSNNLYKLSLGQLSVQNKIETENNEAVEKIDIVDFKKYDGKKIKDVKTLWGESLIEFHKKLFDAYNLKDISFFEETSWYKKRNEKPGEFYDNFFLIVTCFGILFENFLTFNGEGLFTKDVVLPAIKKATDLTGLKPLIVTIEPTSTETDEFWYYHLPIVKKMIPVIKKVK